MSKRIQNRPRRDTRRDQFAATHSRTEKPWWTVAVAVLLGAGLIVAAIYSISAARDARAPEPSPVSSTVLSGDVRLDTAQFADGRARFFSYRTGAGKVIRFFVIRSSDGVIRAALDTCEVCYRERKGYRQVGDAMVCNNCEKVFPSAAINVSQGGCNPVPLQRTVDGSHVVVLATALDAGAAYF